MSDHRGYVGPEDQYDLIGAGQFALLYALGLRGRHRLLDIGCGSLRAGRLLIPYLDTGRYVGVEPELSLVVAAIREELGSDLLALKRPIFDSSASFDYPHLGRFDFVLAHGIATNTGPALLARLLVGISGALGPGGLAAVSVIHPGSADTSAIPAARGFADWRYPGCYSYERDAFARAIEAAGLAGVAIPFSHPRHTWWVLARTPAALPPPAFLASLTGRTLARS